MKTSVENKTDFTSEVCKALKGMGKAYLLILVIVTFLMFIPASASAWVFWITFFGAFYYFVVKPLNDKWIRENPNRPYCCNCYDDWYNSGNPMNPRSPWFDEDFK